MPEGSALVSVASDRDAAQPQELAMGTAGKFLAVPSVPSLVSMALLAQQAGGVTGVLPDMLPVGVMGRSLGHSYGPLLA